MLKQSIWSVLLCAASFHLLGCGRVGQQDAREQRHQLVVEAYEKIEAGEYREAGRLLRAVLDSHPTMARPHLDLAMIFHEHRRDYIRAIYHYHRYMELRPNTEKSDMIRARIDQAKVAFVSSYIRSLPDEIVAAHIRDLEEAGVLDDRAAVQAEVTEREPVVVSEELERELAAAHDTVSEQRLALRALREEREGLQADQERSEEQLRAYESKIEALQDELERLADIIASTRAAVPAASPHDEVDDLAPDTSTLRTYRVRANDSLSGIAQRVYGDAAKWRLIQEANREVLGESEVLRIGQVLVIPDVDNRR